MMWRRAALDSTQLLRVSQGISPSYTFVLTFPPTLGPPSRTPGITFVIENFIVAFTTSLTTCMIIGLSPLPGFEFSHSSF